MGLDASVYCNCYKVGKIKSQPPYSDLVDVDLDGDVYITTPDNEKYFEFEKWKETACEHEGMILIHNRLGNASTIGHVRSKIKIIDKDATLFPILLEKVLYSGTHAGDHLENPDIIKLKLELEQLKVNPSHNVENDDLTNRVINDLYELCENAMRVGNPIVF